MNQIEKKGKLEKITLAPIDQIAGTITLKGSKSISNRALLLAALSQNPCCLSGLLCSEDVEHLLTALAQLGIRYQLSQDKTTCQFLGFPADFKLNDSTLFLGNAGTAMRPLTAILAALHHSEDAPITLTGDARMQERPIAHLVDALKMGGADIGYLAQKGYPPLQIKRGFNGGKIQIKGSISSQYLTALLMAAPLAENPAEIEVIGDLVSKPYVEMTLQMLQQFQIQVIHQEFKRFFIAPQRYIAPAIYAIEGDASSASYFLAAAAIKGKIRIEGFSKNSLQGDVAFADVLAQMGAKVTWHETAIECEKGALKGVDLDLNAIPDAAMTIAIVALFAQGKTKIRNIGNWRVKETDRLAAMNAELTKIGAKVTEGEDWIEIEPPKQFVSAEIETYQDHRMAMCFSLIALAGISITILDPTCTRKTYPDYFADFAKISQLNP